MRVVFRNQCNSTVTVIINGYENGAATRVYSGEISGRSGVFQVSGYSSYACSAYATRMVSPDIARNTDLSVVFEKSEGVSP